MMDATTDVRPDDESLHDESAVVVEDLRFTYPGNDEPTLRGLNFSIGSGEVFGFLGPSGAGKSTAQKVLVGLLEKYEGHATVLGREVSEWGSEYYQRIGVSSESPNQYLKLTGRENLELFASLYDGETRDLGELLAMVGLEDAADQRVDAYSKGMRMRLNFVRSLIHDPDLVFLDEPTSGLDPTNARNVKDIVRGLQNDGVSVFLTTHDMTVADELCDRVAFIVDGTIPVLDAPTSLKKEHGAPLVSVEYRQNGALETAQFDLESLGANAQFERLLDEVRVERIHSSEATLEDVFIEVTGRELV
ncbi:ATP-binding cassette domain-containing protein [Haloferax sp. MBLA0076]|uniref:ATP-binding cassette domain-containing protein n=1 Tax=Haloferax litoreum TaxID=2666140 RepID=A0A6A8GLJ9_9EURY|nr:MULTISPECIES: ABC transporter ATP-binding protein [Haloferax]KAB1190391.1 ABC transporter ATP-binding protein [Haloferax sp. CBA1148]MRX23362.1 ATP-binding cassette domain-containing protein [Haloferax litoreum]